MSYMYSSRTIEVNEKSCKELVHELFDSKFDVANLALELTSLTGGDTCSDDWPRNVASAS